MFHSSLYLGIMLMFINHIRFLLLHFRSEISISHAYVIKIWRCSRASAIQVLSSVTQITIYSITNDKWNNVKCCSYLRAHYLQSVSLFVSLHHADMCMSFRTIVRAVFGLLNCETDFQRLHTSCFFVHVFIRILSKE